MKILGSVKRHLYLYGSLSWPSISALILKCEKTQGDDVRNLFNTLLEIVFIRGQEKERKN